jgi:hypothetical protein
VHVVSGIETTVYFNLNEQKNFGVTEWQMSMQVLACKLSSSTWVTKKHYETGVRTSFWAPGASHTISNERITWLCLIMVHRTEFQWNPTGFWLIVLKQY